MPVQMVWLLMAALGVLWPLVGAFVWFAISRLIRAIDRLTETQAGHALDLVEIKTTLGIKTGS